MSSMMRAHLAAICGMVALGACTTFADDTRKVPARPASSSTDANVGPAPKAPGGSCAMSVVPGAPVGTCGGAGGGDFGGAAETEPNDTTGQAIVGRVPVCGAAANADIDRFTIEVQAGDCFWVSFQAASGMVHVSGGGLETSIPGTIELAFEAASGGRVIVEVSGASSYKLLVRR